MTHAEEDRRRHAEATVARARDARGEAELRALWIELGQWIPVTIVFEPALGYRFTLGEPADWEVHLVGEMSEITLEARRGWDP